MEQKYYHMTIAGCERDLPLCPLNDTMQIAGFVMFGDPELTTACAEELLKRAPEYDYVVVNDNLDETISMVRRIILDSLN